MRNSKQIFTFAVIFLVISVALTGVFIFLELATTILKDSGALSIAFILSLPILYMVFASLVVYYLIAVNTEKQLHIENKYNLGRDNAFFNYFMFERRIKSVRFRNGKRKESYLICFTAGKQETMRNASRNDVVKSYNGLISDYLDKYFRFMSKYKDYENIWCFYHGSFLIYSFGDEAKAREIIDDVEKNLFEIARDNDLKIYVQPFFGVTKTDSEEDLIAAVEHASIARDISEERFEGITFFIPEFEKNTNILEVEAIKNGLINKEFAVFYQPKYDLELKQFVSSEALVRWISPTKGIIPPSKFIDTAVNSGLIHSIDDYVFKKVCADLSETKRRGRRMIPVSINFSMFEFYDTNFVNNIVNTITDFNIPFDMIEIEVTETTTQRNTFMAIAIVNQLRSYGIRVLMDDFGIGYSNLDNLMRIPFDTVKIDKSYIQRMLTDNKSKELVKFLINLCKTNNLEVIAEGVDNIEQVDILRKFKCDEIQGYYYSKPLPKKEYDAFIMDNPFEKKKKEAK